MGACLCCWARRLVLGLSCLVLIGGCQSKDDPGGKENSGKPKETVVAQPDRGPGASTGQPGPGQSPGRRLGPGRGPGGLSDSSRRPPGWKPGGRVTETEGRERFGESLFVEWQPTLATSDPPPAKPDFSKTPNLNKDICLGYSAYMASLVHRMEKPDDVSEDDFALAKEMCTHVLSNILADRKVVDYRRDLNISIDLMEKRGLAEEPLFLFCAGLVAKKMGEFDLAFPRFVKAVEHFRTHHYPSRVVALAHLLHARSWSARVKSSNVPDMPFEELADAVWYQLIHDLDAQPEEYRYVWHVMQKSLAFLRQWRRSVYNELYDQICHDERVPVWFRLMTQTMHLNKLAWEHRGGGFANTVTEQGWKKFAEYQHQAEMTGRQALEENPFAPEPISYLMDIALSGYSETSTREWFDKAVAIQFDYVDVYTQMIRELSPKWGGSLEAMLEFGRQCRDTGRYDTMIPMQLVMVFQSFTSDEPNHPIVNDREVLAELARVIEKSCENAIDGGLYGDFQRHNIPAYSAWGVGFAFRAKDYPLAKRLLELTQEELDQNGLIAAGCRENPELIKQFILVETSSYAEVAAQVQQLLDKVNRREVGLEKIPELVDLCQKVIDETDGPEVRRYFEHYRDECRIALQYIKGEWVTLPFGPKLDNWDGPGRDHLKRIDERTVEFTKKLPADGFQLNARYMLPGPKIIEYELDWSNEPSPPHVLIGSQAGVFGIYRKPYFLGVEPSTRRVYFGPQNWHFTPPGFLIPEVGRHQTALFRIRIGPGYADAFVNGEFVVRAADLPIYPSLGVQVSQPYGYGTRGRIRIRDVRVRRWTIGPPPWHSRDVRKMRDYLAQATEFEPDNRYDLFLRGVFEHQSGDLDAALETFQKVEAMKGAYAPVHFFLGDIYDRRGDKQKALEHYQACMIASQDRPGRLLQLTPTPVPEAHTVASFRAQWIKCTADDEALKNIPDDFLSHFPPVTQFEWANATLHALRNTVAGNPRYGQTQMNLALKSVPEKYRPFLQQIQQTLAAGEPYREPADQKPFYLDLDGLGFDYFLSGYDLLPQNIHDLYVGERNAFFEQLETALKRQELEQEQNDSADPDDDQPTIEPPDESDDHGG